MAAFVGGRFQLLGLFMTGGRLAHQFSRLQELGFLARVCPNGPCHLGRRPVQPGGAWGSLPLVRGGGRRARRVVGLGGRGRAGPGEENNKLLSFSESHANNRKI